MASPLAERLKEARKSLGLNASEMADRVGLAARRSWESYERGQSTPKSEILEKLVELGFSPDWLLTGEGTMRGESASIAPAPSRKSAERPDLDVLRDEIEGIGNGFVLIPRYDVEASAGPGALANAENVVDFMAFQESWVRRVLRTDPRKLALISAVGDSMEPAIRAGDLLLVDTSFDEVEDDAIYVLVMDGHLMVKRLQRFVGGAVSIKSDNPAYVVQTLTADELASYTTVAGRVRWIGRLI